MAGCGGFDSGFQFQCYFWWALNPEARHWFDLIAKGNPKTYAWAYDENFTTWLAALLG